MLTEIRTRSQITIPAEIAKKLSLKTGDTLDIELEGDHIVLRPVIAVPKEQSYFWTNQWQAEEKQVQTDIEKDNIHETNTKEELFKDLGI